MSEQRAFFFPGQGSQKPGMGKDLADNFKVAKECYQEADDALGLSISALCFEGPASELALTSNAQPAILATSIAAFRVLSSESEIEMSVAAGHSLGEWSALVAAGALNFADALRLVRLRGEAMQDAVPVGVGSMAAVLGLEATEVEEVCKNASTPDEVCEPANFNGGGQIVISGNKAAVDRAVGLVKERKKKAIPLKVSAPFHSSLMQPAARKVEEALSKAEVSALSVPVVSNVEAKPNRDADRVKELLVKQVCAPVRWQESVEALAQEGVKKSIEIGHGKVIAGLVKRIAPELEVLPMGSPEDLMALLG